MPNSQARAIAAETQTASRPLWMMLFGGVTALAVAAAAANVARAESHEAMIESHGYSFFGDLKYPADFEHLDYVNPDAPKGGEIVLGATGTFDSLNPYSVKGRSGQLTSIQYESLIESTSDTVGEYYGVLAHTVEYPEDRDYVIFHMRPEARFSDGSPVTAHDVVYSHRLFIEQGLPSYAQAVSRMVTGAEAVDDHTVKFTFAEGITRRSLVETVGSTTVFSKKWFEETGARLDEPRLETAIGSGPYILDDFEVNRRITYKRRDDYWGADLPMRRGFNNYDQIRLEYFSDQTASLEAFKAGEYTFRVEGDPKVWATAYDFAKVDEGIIKTDTLPDGSPPDAVGFVFNLAKPQFADRNVRLALSLAYNFEWTNESLLFGLYSPRSSFVQGTPLEAMGTPEGAELAFLEGLGDVVPAEVFTEDTYQFHESDPARLNDRRNLRRASRMLTEAGWIEGDDGMRRNADGEPFEVVMLIPSNIQDSVDAMNQTFAQNLEILGIQATVEKVDPSQYTERRRNRDFDILYSTRYGAFLSTGGGLSQMYGGAEAEFSVFNPAGLASPFVDAVIEKSFDATSQDETNVALMALDRALRYEFFVIPTGYIADYWVAYFDMYEHPENLPPYALGYLDFWWVNPDKEAALREAGEVR